MSKLEELLQQYCPNGVEYKTVGEIATDIFRGSGITREQVTENGTPCVRYGEIYTTYGVWFDTCVSHTDVSQIVSPKWFGHGDILFAITGEKIDEIAKSCAYIGNDKCLAGGDTVVLQHEQNPKYLAYALSTTIAQEQKSKGKVKSKVVHSNVPSIQSILVPIPPLPIQEKIVQILDDFIRVSNNLAEQLNDELVKRNQQYEYYKEYLLGTGTNVKLGDVAFYVKERVDALSVSNDTYVGVDNLLPNKAGKKTSDYVPSEGKIPAFCIHDVLIGNIRPYLRKIWFADVNGGTNGDVLVIRSRDKTVLDPEYLFYVLSSEIFFNYDNQHAKGAKMPRGDKEAVMEYVFPLPEINEQEEIVRNIKCYNLHFSDIAISIPNEIVARQKQYEYYRDKMLSFEPMKEV